MSIDPNDLSIDMCGKGTSAGERVDEDIVTRLVEGTNSPSLPVRQWERLYLTCRLCALSEDVAPTPREPPRRRLGNLAITECYQLPCPGEAQTDHTRVSESRVSARFEAVV